MSKKSAKQTRLEQVDKDIEALLANKAEIEAEIEAEKKPKLRHGDYGMCVEAGKDRRIVINHEFKLVTAGDGCLHDYEDDRYNPNPVLGNIFDDLEAMQEDVTQFKMENGGLCNLSANYTSIGNLLIKQTDGESIVIHKAQIDTFILKLRQMEATLKRRQE